MDAEYLKTTVGSALAEGLAEVCAVGPADPIEYLAKWLYQHRENLPQSQEENVVSSSQGPARPVVCECGAISWATGTEGVC